MDLERRRPKNEREKGREDLGEGAQIWRNFEGREDETKKSVGIRTVKNAKVVTTSLRGIFFSI